MVSFTNVLKYMMVLKQISFFYLLVAIFGLWPLAINPQAAVAAERAPCKHYNTLRQPFFGDLHIHTAFSLDAEMQGTRTMPRDAYRFLKGEAIGVPPYDADGRPLRTAQLERPLDFAAVTDHAELFGELQICRNADEEGYDSFACSLYRYAPQKMGLVFNKNSSEGERMGFCGENDSLCREAAKGPWRETQTAAAEAYDQSDDCQFTSFVAYEWTAGAFPQAGKVANLHRNVIFKNQYVPEYPISTMEAKTAPELWRQLEQQCTQAVVAGQGNNDEKCDVVVIPHNSNLSMGQMFLPTLPEADLRLQAKMELLVEMIQHKGSSECYYGAYGQIAEDELCGFEQLPWNSFSGNRFQIFSAPPEPGDGFVREVLRDGLRVEQQQGFNPFKLGFIGSTDTHRSLGGGAEEYDYPGHGGAGNAGPEGEVQGLPDQWEFNPGGLAVLYAEENTRESLFAAMKRKEAYATSGPRMQVRFFGGDLAKDICSQPQMLSQAYTQGVPMGGTLKGEALKGGTLKSGTSDADTFDANSAPGFLVAATKDPGTVQHPGLDLQQIQIVKGWVDAQGQSREQVYTVAGDASNDAGVDIATCLPQGSGYKQLCQYWQDPDFQKHQPAYYYARVLENPSCRWNTYSCNAQRISCDQPGLLSAEQAQCCDSNIPKTIQERAWTSPIWYSP